MSSAAHSDCAAVHERGASTRSSYSIVKPAKSVVDKHHRSHDVPNLFVCDGSSLVTSGRGQPTMTIQALAFRAGEHLAGFARKNEI